MTKYWEKETPVTVTTNKNVLQYYPKAGKLSVARSAWTDDDGKERQGKTVCFDIDALLESGTEAINSTRAMLADIMEQLNEKI